jgi:putative peptidoglycan lipid II flippase
MTYAGLLIQMPVGILSNVILVPLLPVFSRLAAPEDWPALKDRIRQGLILTAITMLPLSAVTIALALPIVRVVYERYAFSLEDSYLTTTVLIAYAVGMFFYLGRDVLVRVFYGLGDGVTPFRISIINIFINAVLDALLVGPLGAPGLILATVGVNILSMVMMLVLLHRRLNGLPLRSWAAPLVGLTGASAIAGGVSWATLRACEQMMGNEGLLILLAQLCIAGIAGLGVFALIAMRLRLPEFDSMVNLVRQKLLRQRRG